MTATGPPTRLSPRPALADGAAGAREAEAAPRPPRVLIVRLSAIGDVIVTTPVARALRQAIPGAFVAWLVEPRAAELIQGNPFLDEVIVWPRPKGRLRLRDLVWISRTLPAYRFDWVIDCQGLMRSALAARLAGGRVVGNRRPKECADLLYHVRVPRDPLDPSNRQRCLDLLAPLGVRSRDRRMFLPITDGDRDAARRTLREAGVATGPYACFAPATTWRQKHWFAERWAGLAEGLAARGVSSLLLGSAADGALMARIQRESSRAAVSLAGRTTLRCAAALLQDAAVVVAVDTGLMHAAVATGAPTVGLCGASGWPGFQDYENFTLVREPMRCSPCLHRPTCHGRFDCMRALTVDRVLAAAGRVLSAPRAQGPVAL